MSDACQATPPDELERQICSATEPKNEREWWAHHEIARLRAALAEADEPVAWYRPSEEGYDPAFRDHSAVVFCAGNKWEDWIPLFTHPPRREPVAWRTEAARWLRRQADDADWDSEHTGWANPARHIPATLRRIADDLEAEQEAAPYGLDCSPETRREPLTDDFALALWGAKYDGLDDEEVLDYCRAVERAHGIGGDE